MLSDLGYFPNFRKTILLTSQKPPIKLHVSILKKYILALGDIVDMCALVVKVRWGASGTSELVCEHSYNSRPDEFTPLKRCAYTSLAPLRLLWPFDVVALARNISLSTPLAAHRPIRPIPKRTLRCCRIGTLYIPIPTAGGTSTPRVPDRTLRGCRIGGVI